MTHDIKQALIENLKKEIEEADSLKWDSEYFDGKWDGLSTAIDTIRNHDFMGDAAIREDAGDVRRQAESMSLTYATHSNEETQASSSPTNASCEVSYKTFMESKEVAELGFTRYRLFEAGYESGLADGKRQNEQQQGDFVDKARAWDAVIKARTEERESPSQWQDIAVKEIVPCPYVNTPLSKNNDVNFILKPYPAYTDFILFDDGKPLRCFRFSAPPTTKTEDNT